MTTRVVVLGGGYTGLCALERLGGRPELDLHLVDARNASESLPLLPDMIGRDLSARWLRYDLAGFAARVGAGFEHDHIEAVDPAGLRLIGRYGEHPFDAAIIAPGVATDFHGQDWAPLTAFPCRSCAQAVALRRRLTSEPERPLVVCGGGYTGVELVTAAWRFDRRRGRRRRLLLVEAMEEICLTQPPAARYFVREHLERLGIEIRTRTMVAGADADGVELAGGERIADALLAWTAGVRAPDCLDGFAGERGPQGRLRVDPDLRLAPGILGAGDSVALDLGAGPLRMSVQFAREMGMHAADNLLRELRGRPLQALQPFDPGWVVPMGHGWACGDVVGLRCYGKAPLLLHYLMSTVRSYGLANRVGLLRNYLALGI